MADNPKNRLGELVRRYRRRAGLTQQEAASHAGISVAGLRDVEQGRVSRPRVSTLRRLASVLELTAVELSELVEEAEGGRRERAGLRVELLGPLRVTVDGSVIDPGSERQHVLLGLLALSPNTPVPRDVLIEGVWGANSTADASGELLQSRISRLRRRLQPDRNEDEPTRVLVADRGGYQLTVSESQHDLLRFRRLITLARQAREAMRSSEACQLYADAVALWRGDPLEGLAVLQTHPAVVALMREYRAVMVEYATVAADLGRHQEVLPLLQRVAEADPLHETVHAALMISLAGNGQQAEALGVFDTLRRRLADELGADPGPDLASAHQRVLRQEVRRPEFVPVSAHRQLPPDIADFTGRAAELEILCGDPPGRNRTTGPVWLIVGMGGVGKTRLAVHAAHRLLASGRYGDCQLYVDLRGHSEQAPADPAAVLATFLRLLGVPQEQIPPRVDQRAALYRDRLYHRRALVLLDNVSNEEQLEPLLPSGVDNLVLATSRRTLALDAGRTVRLEAFDPAESEQLLKAVVGDQRVEAEHDAARRVVDLCGGLPMAVTLAARRLQSRPAWAIGDLADRLADGNDRIRELAAGGRRLGTIFELSYRALEDEARRVFRLLGLHPGDDVTVMSVAALADRPPVTARRLLDELVDENLVTAVARDRYRLHDLLADYAHLLVAEEEPEQSRREALTRVLDYYLHAATRAADLLQPRQPVVPPTGEVPAYLPELSDADEARRWMEAERALLIAAVTVAAEWGRPTHAWQLTRALRAYLRLYGYGPDLDWVPVHEAALAAAIGTGDLTGEAETRLDLGSTCLHHGRAMDAAEHLHRGLDCARQADDRVLQMRTLGALGVMSEHVGDFVEATGYFRHAAEMADGHDPGYLGFMHVRIGAALAVLGCLDEALWHQRRAYELCQEVEEVNGECAALTELGDLHRRLGRYSEALHYLNQSLALARRAGLMPRVAYAQHRLGNVYRELGSFGDAKTHLTGALSIVRTVVGPAVETALLIDLAAAYRDIGDLSGAYDLVAQGLRMAVDRNERYQQARALNELGELHRCAARAELANDCWRRARGLFQELAVPEDRTAPQLANPA